ncbi:MAG TPA: sensor domain-containing diguanylate cyclase [Desulfatiglandales bacterium]|nr:sensor domain-containing diguanylate cyclase [Desulfatiglandales bacterium]
MDTESPLTRHELLSCMELGRVLTAELNSERLFGKILQKVSDLLPAENWSLLLIDDATGELHFELSVGLDLDLVKDIRLRLGEGIAGQAALQKKPMIVADVKTCGFFSGQIDQRSGSTTKSVMCAPLIFGGEAVGVIEVANPRSLQHNAIALLSMIADYAAIAVENMRRYRCIQHQAIHDNLTGLYNTRYLYTALADLIRASEVSRDSFSLIFMDIDNFKRVVDTYGHLKGSQALQEVAKTIRESLAEPALAVAYGGDEFVAVLPGYQKSRAIQKAEEIRLRMSQTVYLGEYGHNVSLRASFGLATYPDDATDLTSILALADRAMFDVKERGKDTIKPA